LPRLAAVSGRKVVRALERAGYELIRWRGSHAVMVNRETNQTIPVPVHGSKPLRTGTLRSIIRDAGLTVDEFRGILE